jgi:hypothetical protein
LIGGMPSMGEMVESEWRSYLESVIPKDAPRVQVVESRRAFYAGAHSLLSLLARRLGPGAEPTQADLALMDQIKAELDAFNASVASGGA